MLSINTCVPLTEMSHPIAFRSPLLCHTGTTRYHKPLQDQELPCPLTFMGPELRRDARAEEGAKAAL